MMLTFDDVVLMKGRPPMVRGGQVGVAAAIPICVATAVLSLWTMYLLITLYVERKAFLVLPLSQTSLQSLSLFKPFQKSQFHSPFFLVFSPRIKLHLGNRFKSPCDPIYMGQDPSLGLCFLLFYFLETPRMFLGLIVD